MISFIQDKIFFCFLLISITCNLSAQESSSYYYENEFELFLPLKETLSLEFGIGNRAMFQERLEGEKVSGYQHEHLEVNYFTNYGISEYLIVSLGLRYRVRELFDSEEKDEFRIIEQVEIEPSNTIIPLSHRFRLEQRFREATIHRVRYAIETAKPLNRYFSIGVGTEALYTVSSHFKPEAEQRFAIGIENGSFKSFELEVIVEYRMENFVHNLAHEFFVITGVNIGL